MSELVAGNIFIRPNYLTKGQIINGHAHNFDHVSYCTSGSVHIEAVIPQSDGSSKTLTRTLKATDSRNWILIKAGVEHKIIALEDNTKFDCIYSHRTPQGDVVEEYTGWEAAYV